MGELQHTVLGCCGVYDTIRVQLLHILLSVSAVVTPLNFPNRFGVLKAHPNFNSVVTELGYMTILITLLLSAVYIRLGLNLSNRFSTYCVFLDFAKAFDSVLHQRLLLKLKAYGINDSMLKWFSSFLTTRR